MAYVTEPKGCKLRYGQRIEIKYLSHNGRYAITKYGRYDVIRFSTDPPSDYLIPPPKYVPKYNPTFKLKSYKELYYELLDDVKEAFSNGTERKLYEKLLKIK